MAGEPGVPYRADTGGGVGTTPDLRNPLGAPNILKPEDFIAMANFNDPTVALKNAYDLTSSLIDNHYKNQMDLAKSQADLQYSAARTRGLDTDTDIIQRTADDKVAQEHLLTQLKQQEYDQNARVNPLIVQEKQNDVQLKKIGVDDLQRQSDDNTAALNALPAAIKALPSPDDPDYITKREQFRIQNNNLFTNLRTAKQMQNAYDANDQLYQAKLSTQQTVANRKEAADLLQGGYLNKAIDPDRLMQSPDRENQLTGGRMNRSRHALEVMAASLPDGDPVKAQMQAIVDKADGYIKSENGVKDVQAGRAADIFDTNGDLSATQQGMANRVQAHITDLVKNGVIKPTSDLEIGLGTPDAKGEYQQKMKVTGTADIIDAWRQKLGFKTSQEIEAEAQQKKDQEAVKNQATLNPQVQAIWQQYRDNKITKDEAVKQVDEFMHPGAAKPSALPAPAAKPPGSASTESTQDNTGVADFFRKRGDQPITSSDDPRLTTVNVGDQKWRVHEEAAPYFQGFLNELASKGAPVTSSGGWAYRQKVGASGLSEHAFGGAIDVNQTGRDEVTPEFQKWIAANPGALQEAEKNWNIYGGERFGDLGHFEWGGQTQRPTAQAALPDHALPRPASVAHARALPRGTHFLDPYGNRRMVA
jgi:hypothetical protein